MNQFLFLCTFCTIVIDASISIPETPVVGTTDGPIVGSINRGKDGNVYHFYGIPYAEPPVGKLRFMKPSQSRLRKDIYRATRVKPECMHFNEFLRYVHVPISEDCLYLNILVTENAFLNSNKTKRPVMFWIHGGAFSYGSGGQFPFLSDVLVASQDIILVTINYRLDIFGFLYHDKIPKFIGNQGIWDQNMALRWVKNNIAAFGGDPNSITIFGESVGGLSVLLHMSSPYATGLFTRAIAQSTTPLFNTYQANLQNSISTEIVLERSGCKKAKSQLECLQSIPANKLVLLVPDKKLSFGTIYGDEYVPVSQYDLFLGNSYVNDVDFLFGRTHDDGSALMSGLLYQLFSKPKLTYQDALDMISVVFKPEAVEQVARWYVGEPGKKISSHRIQYGIRALTTDVLFGAGFEAGRRYALRQRIGSTNAYIVAQNPRKNIIPVCTLDREYGVCHQDDLMFIFGRPFANPKAYSDDDREVSLQMMKVWANSARTG